MQEENIDHSFKDLSCFNDCHILTPVMAGKWYKIYLHGILEQTKCREERPKSCTQIYGHIFEGIFLHSFLKCTGCLVAMITEKVECSTTLNCGHLLTHVSTTNLPPVKADELPLCLKWRQWRQKQSQPTVVYAVNRSCTLKQVQVSMSKQLLRFLCKSMGYTS